MHARVLSQMHSKQCTTQKRARTQLCVLAYLRACVHACACVRACVRACVYARMHSFRARRWCSKRSSRGSWSSPRVGPRHLALRPWYDAHMLRLRPVCVCVSLYMYVCLCVREWEEERGTMTPTVTRCVNSVVRQSRPPDRDPAEGRRKHAGNTPLSCGNTPHKAGAEACQSALRRACASPPPPAAAGRRWSTQTRRPSRGWSRWHACARARTHTHTHTHIHTHTHTGPHIPSSIPHPTPHSPPPRAHTHTHALFTSNHGRYPARRTLSHGFDERVGLGPGARTVAGNRPELDSPALGAWGALGGSTCASNPVPPET